MVSSSSTQQATTSNTSDERQIADGEGVAINSGGGDVRFVPDEAFDLAQFALAENSYVATDALDKVADSQANALEKVADGQLFALDEVARANREALDTAIQAQKSESGQISEQVVKLGIPALALAFIVGAIRQ
jgi:hypothetical protein